MYLLLQVVISFFAANLLFKANKTHREQLSEGTMHKHVTHRPAAVNCA